MPSPPPPLASATLAAASPPRAAALHRRSQPRGVQELEGQPSGPREEGDKPCPPSFFVVDAADVLPMVESEADERKSHQSHPDWSSAEVEQMRDFFAPWLPLPLPSAPAPAAKAAGRTEGAKREGEGNEGVGVEARANREGRAGAEEVAGERDALTAHSSPLPETAASAGGAAAREGVAKKSNKTASRRLEPDQLELLGLSYPLTGGGAPSPSELEQLLAALESPEKLCFRYHGDIHGGGGGGGGGGDFVQRPAPRIACVDVPADPEAPAGQVADGWASELGAAFGLRLSTTESIRAARRCRQALARNRTATAFYYAYGFSTAEEAADGASESAARRRCEEEGGLAFGAVQPLFSHNVLPLPIVALRASKFAKNLLKQRKKFRVPAALDAAATAAACSLELRTWRHGEFASSAVTERFEGAELGADDGADDGFSLQDAQTRPSGGAAGKERIAQRVLAAIQRSNHILVQLSPNQTAAIEAAAAAAAHFFALPPAAREWKHARFVHERRNGWCSQPNRTDACNEAVRRYEVAEHSGAGAGRAGASGTAPEGSPAAALLPLLDAALGVLRLLTQRVLALLEQALRLPEGLLLDAYKYSLTCSAGDFANQADGDDHARADAGGQGGGEEEATECKGMHVKVNLYRMAADFSRGHGEPPGDDIVQIRPHADLGLITAAPLSAVRGLQAATLGGDGWRWTDLEPRSRAGEVVVFGGGLLAWLTGGAVRPLLHRVVTFAGGDRISMPLFVKPTAETGIQVARRPDGWRELQPADWRPAGSGVSFSHDRYLDLQRKHEVTRSATIHCAAKDIGNCSLAQEMREAR